MIFLFFTKTLWSEPPRMRHQLAKLLADRGHQVYFFQRPVYAWQSAASTQKVEKNITVVQSKQLIHHQLRLTRLIRFLNAKAEVFFLKRKIKELNLKDYVVVNFNYDYFFLRNMHPGHKIITMINDDFLALAKTAYVKPLEEALSRTGQMSDYVLTVSSVLQSQLSSFCEPILFLPWSEQPYRTYGVPALKKSILIWAYLNARVDFDLIEKIAKENPQYILYLVGPQDEVIQHDMRRLEQLENINVLPSTPLHELPLGEFLAALIPYRKNIKGVEATMLANKSVRLMACGLPLVIQGMPHFYQHPAIFKLESDTFEHSLEVIEKNWESLQSSIQTFITEHSEDRRYQQLAQLI